MDCRHHWVIPGPDGVTPKPTALGRCKLCKATREFTIGEAPTKWSMTQDAAKRVAQ